MASSIGCAADIVGFGKNELSYSARSYPLGGLILKKESVNMREMRYKRTTIKAMRAKYKGTHTKEQQLTEMIEKKVVQAREVCEGDATSVECKVAWDEVEEVSQAKADLRRKMEKEDPLEYYCAENPDTDECRIYED